jgi:hypothetical protein
MTRKCPDPHAGSSTFRDRSDAGTAVTRSAGISWGT